MKSIMVAAILAGGTCLIATVAQTRKTSPAKEFMREKLAHSQSVLEGIALEDYQLILTHSSKLSAMSQNSSWKVFQNPEYLEHSATFRRLADTLTRAARERNLDEATVAYLGMTMSCVDCHKFVRGKRLAQTGSGKTFPSRAPTTGKLKN